MVSDILNPELAVTLHKNGFHIIYLDFSTFMNKMLKPTDGMTEEIKNMLMKIKNINY